MDSRNKHSNFTSLKKLIPQAAELHKAERHYAKYQVFAAWEQAVVGFFAEAKQLTKPIEFEKGKLIVACLSQDLQTLLKQVAQQLLRALNDLLGKTLVYSLVIET